MFFSNMSERRREALMQARTWKTHGSRSACATWIEAQMAPWCNLAKDLAAKGEIMLAGVQAAMTS